MRTAMIVSHSLLAIVPVIGLAIGFIDNLLGWNDGRFHVFEQVAGIDDLVVNVHLEAIVGRKD